MPNRREFIQSIGAAAIGSWNKEPQIEIRLLFTESYTNGQIRDLKKSIKRAFYGAGIKRIAVDDLKIDAPDFDTAKDGVLWMERKIGGSYDSNVLVVESGDWSYAGLARVNGDDAVVRSDGVITSDTAKHVILHEIGHNLGLEHWQAETHEDHETIENTTPAKDRNGAGFSVETEERDAYSVMRTRPESHTYTLEFSAESKRELQRKYA